MKFFSLNGSPIFIPGGIATKSLIHTTKDDVIDRACAFGNAGTPIADKTISVQPGSVLFINPFCQIGLLDTKPPILSIKSGATTLAKVGFTLFPEVFVIELPPTLAGNLTLSVDMSHIVDGGCGYVAFSSKGGIS